MKAAHSALVIFATFGCSHAADAAAKPGLMRKAESARADAMLPSNAALAETDKSKSNSNVMYVLSMQSKEEAAAEVANAQRIERAKEWRMAVNPVDDYDGPTDPTSIAEISKRRTKKTKGYDGMQAVGSGFWADDRPNERRVDMSDHKIYTWRQFRLKHKDVHAWDAEAMWKRLPTEKRVKKIGKLAFVQRFR